MYNVNDKFLNLKHSSDLLLFLLKNKQVTQGELLAVVPSNLSIYKLLESGVNDGYINVSKVIVGRPKKLISITGKGRAVAEKLQEAQDVAEGKTRICQHCNTENDMDAVYCKHCGARME